MKWVQCKKSGDYDYRSDSGMLAGWVTQRSTPYTDRWIARITLGPKETFMPNELDEAKAWLETQYVMKRLDP